MHGVLAHPSPSSPSQDEYVDELSASVRKLADHWKHEAEKQAELGRKAGSADFVAKAERIQVRGGTREGGRLWGGLVPGEADWMGP